MSSPQRSVSNRYLFKRFCILKLQSAYIISVMTFIVYKNEVSVTNSKFYKVNTKHRHDIHRQCSKKLYTMQELKCITSSQ